MWAWLLGGTFMTYWLVPNIITNWLFPCDDPDEKGWEGQVPGWKTLLVFCNTIGWEGTMPGWGTPLVFFKIPLCVFQPTLGVKGWEPPTYKAQEL